MALDVHPMVISRKPGAGNLQDFPARFDPELGCSGSREGPSAWLRT